MSLPFTFPGGNDMAQRRSHTILALVLTGSLLQPSTFLHADDDPAVANARKTVKMLDDLYKTTVVLITDTYVEDETSVSAATAAIALWKAMSDKGWHHARLIDATGDPYDLKNVAKTDFEKKNLKRLTTENNYIDHVSTEDGKRYLEVLTQVPVVMDKCKLCHPSYNDLPAGQTIGAISYRFPID